MFLFGFGIPGGIFVALLFTYIVQSLLYAAIIPFKSWKAGRFYRIMLTLLLINFVCPAALLLAGLRGSIVKIWLNPSLAISFFLLTAIILIVRERARLSSK
ncbi:MAG TPA: hypothetical protein VFV50_06675 [Bdellovibrionales bacterium]|nr:hypothetical protein [Bdellovibrionales bacterium]